jgi:ketosteroid isomerase-like protein
MALVLGIAGCATLGPRVNPEAEQVAIREAMARGARALEQHDWPSYTRFWANDPTIEVLHPAGREWIVGWDSTARKYQALIADTATTYRFTNLRQSIHVSPRGDMVWVTQEDRIDLTRAGGPTQSVTQWSTSVFEKRAGEWRLVHAHASVPPRPR